MNARIFQISIWTIIVLIIIAAAPNKVEASQLRDDKQLLSGSKSTPESKINPGIKTDWGYCHEPSVKIIKTNDTSYRLYHCMWEKTGYFEIYRKDRKIYSEWIKDVEFGIYDLNDPLSECSQVPLPGTDINGDGIPEMVMRHHTGQGQFTDRYSYPIYSIGKRVRKLVTLEGMHSPMQFKDLDGDGLYEVTGDDWVLAYFFGDFLSSPHPNIILKWQKGSYRLAFKLMKKPPPAHEELKKKAGDFRIHLEKENGPFPEGYVFNIPYYQHTAAWNYLVDLIYSGNAKAAWAFLDMYWIIPLDCTKVKEKHQEKREFTTALKKQLTRSLYWKDLKTLNGEH
jgi:hypothetical protein